MFTPSSVARCHSSSARSADFLENRSSATSGGIPNASSSAEIESKTLPGSLKCLSRRFADRSPSPRTRNIRRAAFLRTSFSTQAPSARFRPNVILMTEYGTHQKGIAMFRRLILAVLLTSTVALAQHPEDAFVGQKAPELKQGDLWINSGPLKLEQLRGKVVLIDFWAFDCPFCMEAMPHVKELYDKYSKDGLVVIGVHVPR